MNESENVIEHVNKMSVIAKELAVSRNPIPDKMQVSTICLVCLTHGIL